jgi:hypothetical protein
LSITRVHNDCASNYVLYYLFPGGTVHSCVHVCAHISDVHNSTTVLIVLLATVVLLARLVSCDFTQSPNYTECTCAQVPLYLFYKLHTSSTITREG